MWTQNANRLTKKGEYTFQGKTNQFIPCATGDTLCRNMTKKWTFWSSVITTSCNQSVCECPGMHVFVLVMLFSLYSSSLMFASKKLYFMIAHTKKLHSQYAWIKKTFSLWLSFTILCYKSDEIHTHIHTHTLTCLDLALQNSCHMLTPSQNRL